MKHWRLIAAGLLAVAVLTGSLVAALGSSSTPARWDPGAPPQPAAQRRTLEREALQRELTAIQQDPSYTEYLIRKNLGYVKKGEVEYRIMKPTSTSTQ